MGGDAYNFSYSVQRSVSQITKTRWPAYAQEKCERNSLRGTARFKVIVGAHLEYGQGGGGALTIPKKKCCAAFATILVARFRRSGKRKRCKIGISEKNENDKHNCAIVTDDQLRERVALLPCDRNVREDSRRPTFKGLTAGTRWAESRIGARASSTSGTVSSFSVKFPPSRQFPSDPRSPKIDCSKFRPILEIIYIDREILYKYGTKRPVLGTGVRGQDQRSPPSC